MSGSCSSRISATPRRAGCAPTSRASTCSCSTTCRWTMRPTAELRLLASLGMALFCVTAAGVAAGPTRPQVRGPIKITAERAELERREYALYRGHVRLTSADMVLTGDRLELRQPARGQYEARLTGAPARLDHAGDDKNPPVSASATQIVYDTR